MKYFLMFVGLFLIVGCSSGENVEIDTNDDHTNEATQSDVTVKFAGIDIVYRRNAIHISGDVQTTEDYFYYILDNDGEVLIEETKIKVDDPGGEWSTFAFEVDIEDQDLTNEDVPFLTFYGKDGERMINPNYVPVDLKLILY